MKRLAWLALVCFGLHAALAPREDTAIEVTPTMVDALVAQQASLFGRPLTDQERAEMIEAFIEEELLVREALRLGLDRGDPRIRSMLAAQTRSETLRAAGYVHTEPDGSELRAFYEKNRERYRAPERVDLEQVLFPLGTMTDTAGRTLEALRSGADYRTMGEAGPAARVSDLSRAEIASAYGLTLANALFEIRDDAWHGPFTSDAGTHFVRLAARRPGRERGFEDVAAYVREDMAREAEREEIDRELSRVRWRYRVEVDR